MKLFTIERYKPQDIALLLHLGPLLLVYLLWLDTRPAFVNLEHRETLLAFAMSLLVASNVVLLVLRSQLASFINLFGLSWAALATLNHYTDSPSSFLILFTIIVWLMQHLRSLGKQRQAVALRDYPWKISFASACFSVFLNLLAHYMDTNANKLIYTAVNYSNLISLAWIGLATSKKQLNAWTGSLLQIVIVLICIAFLSYLDEHWIAIAAESTALLVYLSFLRKRPFSYLKRSLTKTTDLLFRRPEASVVIYFFFLSLIGSLVLYSPFSIRESVDLSWVDVAFTAISAACINGLSILDISASYSFFGQAVILVLIQLGGLGIMSLSTLVFLLLGRRLSVKEENLVSDSTGQTFKGELSSALSSLVKLTLGIEFAGALVLTIAFSIEGMSIKTAFWSSIFTAISAFCNAGFSLFTNSLREYADNPLIIYTVSLLILSGSLSPAFLIALKNRLKGQKSSLQFKIMALANLILVLVGFFSFLSLEWNQSLAEFSTISKIHHAWFQSITARSAGFNTVDMSLLHPATVFIIMTLMFIGANPGGTGGGIRTTTFMVLAFTMISVARARDHVQAFGRNIAIESVYRATTVVISGLVVGFVGLLSLLTTQRADPIRLLFDVVSASSNVGLSLGAVGELDSIGKLLIMIMMFFGRIGSLSIILYLGHTSIKTSWRHPQEDISVA